MNIMASVVENQNEEEISNYLESTAAKLSDPINAIPLTRKTSFPDKPGIYCIFEKNALIYAGETGSIKSRMKDIFRTMNHSFRRSLGKRKFAEIPDVMSASSKSNFPPEVELQLTEFMESNLLVKVMPALIGRKEIEERIIGNHTTLFNSRGRRGQKTAP